MALARTTAVSSSLEIEVEKLMNEGYLDTIFPHQRLLPALISARTVELVQSTRYNSKELVDLTAIESHQAVGRAGRRGKHRSALPWWWTAVSESAPY